ncbi:MAG: bifunctional diaminohydroxyphosphoribosylaminopyrimidine deaminase/5-amino-6-(5-phosphoribosylamino)uracil reductase RibD [Thermoguttaceae bacterium]|jgi:diaminohydroxyphosphoribosylaminopyrimidine deaminase/5-amino-6-(5-phosphoribosylamino)uracil reductase
MQQHEIDLWHIRRALELARRGEGLVEPNPMVGCVIAQGAEIIGEGWHRRFGEAHAEVEALQIAGDRAAGGTLYVTLEPCCHHGKTPPCTDAILASGVRRVVVAMRDPFPQVQGGGIAALRAVGIAVEVGLLQAEAVRLNAPYLKLVETGQPWIIAKWAMTLDGKIATHTGESQWISNPRSREIVHALRGRVDAVVIGRGTAERDDPLLTARPGTVPIIAAAKMGLSPSAAMAQRIAARVILDTQASLSSESQLVRTVGQSPVLVAVGNEAPAANCHRLRDAGCEVFVCDGQTHAARLDALLAEFGRRRWTNVLVEGGGRLLGSLLDARTIDEVHVFIAAKLLGGASAATPIAGCGIAEISAAFSLELPQVRQLDGDVYITARSGSGSWRSNRAGREPCSTDT